MSLFTAKEWQRYQRHVQLKQFGASGQTALKHAHVLIVGAGGLGCPAAQYLGAAGVGNITIVDPDTIDASNLQRQILFTEADIGAAKAEIAAQRLIANNSSIRVTAVCEALSSDNAADLIKAADLVLDCTDSFATRYLINDTCLQTATPWLFASVIQYAGQVALFTPQTACFRCLFAKPPSSPQDCNSAGVLGSMPGVLATIQATEALKYLSGLPCDLAGELLLVDAIGTDFTKIGIAKNPTCHCQSGTVPSASADAAANCEPVAWQAGQLTALEFEQLRTTTDALLIDVRSAAEHAAFNLGGEQMEYGDTFVDHFSASRPALSTPILLYCQTGMRSDKAATALRQAGYDKVQSLRGGLAEWLTQLA